MQTTALKHPYKLNGGLIFVYSLVFFLFIGMHSLFAEIQVLAFAGSTREDSLNKKLVSEAARLASQMGAHVRMINLKDYSAPFYDGDLEKQEGMPTKARQFRQLMIQNNVILIASPEYNGSLSAVLKNALDWASRDENGNPSREAFKGKKFVIMSASPGEGGGIRGLAHLRSIIENVGGTVISQQLVIPNAYQAFDTQGYLNNSQLKMELKQLIQTAIH